MERGASIVIPRPDPLTLLVPTWAVFWGVVGALQLHNAPPASTEAVPAFAAYVFFVGLAVTSAALLLGMALRSVRGVKIKLGANVTLGLLCLVYAGWAVQALGIARPIVLVSWLLTISVASFWQARRLNAVLNPKE